MSPRPRISLFLSIRTAAFLQRRSRHRCHLPFLDLQHDYFVLYQAYIRAKRLMRILGENACGRGTSSQKIRRTKVELSKSRSELIINRHMLRLMTTWNGGLGEICVRIDLAHACPLRQMTSPGVVTSRALCWSSPLTHMQIRNPSAIAMVGIFQLHSL